jgi:hypothetical protein
VHNLGTTINSYQKRAGFRPACIPPDPHWHFPLLFGEGDLRCLVPKWVGALGTPLPNEGYKFHGDQEGSKLDPKFACPIRSCWWRICKARYSFKLNSISMVTKQDPKPKVTIILVGRDFYFCCKHAF